MLSRRDLTVAVVVAEDDEPDLGREGVNTRVASFALKTGFLGLNPTAATVLGADPEACGREYNRE